MGSLHSCSIRCFHWRRFYIKVWSTLHVTRYTKSTSNTFFKCALPHSQTVNLVLMAYVLNLNVKSNIAMQYQQRIHSRRLYIISHSNKIQQKLRSQMVASYKILFAKSKNCSERNRAELLYELNMERCEVSNWKASNLHMNEFVKVIEFLIKVHSSKTPRFLFCYINNTFPSRLMFCSLAFSQWRWQK